MRIQDSEYVHHVVCSGNNDQDIFIGKDDYLKYITLLEEARREYPLRVYNFCLLNNHLHLLVEPMAEGSLSKVMQLVTKRYALYFNKKYNRKGHVFQGRFKSFLLQEQPYFFASCRYIDFDAVNLKKATDPKEYPWAGYAHLAAGKASPIKLDEHELYHALGANSSERQIAYRALIAHYAGEPIDFMNRRADIMGNAPFRKQVRGNGAGKNK